MRYPPTLSSERRRVGDQYHLALGAAFLVAFFFAAAFGFAEALGLAAFFGAAFFAAFFGVALLVPLLIVSPPKALSTEVDQDLPRE